MPNGINGGTQQYGCVRYSPTLSGMGDNRKEQPLPPNGACLLGSFNLTKYVRQVKFNGTLNKPNTLEFDLIKLGNDVSLAVEFLDSVIDNTIYPLEDQRQEALNKRRMGIGVTGAANAIELLGFEYGSDDFIRTLEGILKHITVSAYVTSARLAKDKGPFPLFEPDLYLQSKFVQKLPESVQLLIRTFGMRNSHLISIAPTGTISLCADNISSGIEPVFTHTYNRTRLVDGGEVTEEVSDWAYRVHGLKGKSALELSPAEHIKVLAAAQKYCDSAVSKTVNIGDDVTYEQFKNVYIDAYNAGAKGCTTFRASGKRMGILTVKSEDKRETDNSDIFIPGVTDAETSEACTFDAETGRKTCE